MSPATALVFFYIILWSAALKPVLHAENPTIMFSETKASGAEATGSGLMKVSL